jgi:hypothetical protein
MEEYTNRELGLRLDNLIKTTEEGFKGVHARQDKTNGKVKCHTDEIKQIQTWQNKVTGALLVMNIIMLPVVIMLVKVFLDKV